MYRIDLLFPPPFLLYLVDVVIINGSGLYLFRSSPLFLLIHLQPYINKFCGIRLR